MSKSGKGRGCGPGSSKTTFKTQVEYLHENTLQSTDDYHHETAFSVLSTIESDKPHQSPKRYNFHAQDNGIKVKSLSRFGGKVHQKFYAFKDIRHYYSFQDHPTILILASEHPITHRKRFEYYRMPEADIPKLCEIIDRAHRNIENSGSAMQTHQSVPNLTESPEPKSDMKQRAISSDVVYYQEDGDQEDVIIEANSFPTVENKPLGSQDRPSTKDKISNNVSPEIINVPPLCNLPEPLDEQNHWPNHNGSRSENSPREEDMKRFCENIDKDKCTAYGLTYIASDPVKGNKIDTDRGSVYMFVAHYLPDGTRKEDTSYIEQSHGYPHEERFEEAFMAS